jgi:hypothetical protein
MIYAALLAMVVVFAVKYISALFKAPAQRSSDRHYRMLAERAVAAQPQAQRTMAGVQANLAQSAASLAAVEQLLKRVE